MDSGMNLGGMTLYEAGPWDPYWVQGEATGGTPIIPEFRDFIVLKTKI
jgi:hypothetical protein